jgi:predicted dehydrogenase
MNNLDAKQDRRKFITNSVKIAALPLASTMSSAVATGSPSKDKRKLAIVGTGSRGTSMWGKSVVERYSGQTEFVGICDANIKRAKYAQNLFAKNSPVYESKDFDKMIRETEPDTVIVTTTDAFHANYVTRALNLGCDVICEKPLVTDANQASEILTAEKNSGKKIFTTFNARFGNSTEEIKKILSSGELGRVISAEFQEYLDVSHGASYFRRWHGKIRYSGSLLVHKASHHFDQMNWWLDAEPSEVHAFGDVRFYGKNNPYRSSNCRGCPFSSKCDFYFDITKNKGHMDLYVNCEDVDGYLRDGCVWDNDIDTYDSMTVEVQYHNDVLLSYSLNAFMPYEGQRIAFNCEKGRLDVREYFRQPWSVESNSEFRLTKSFGETKTWGVKAGEGGHGGSDEKLKDLLFLPDVEDPLNQIADSRAGVLSSMIGIAARESIETGSRIKIADMIDFPPTWGW